MGINSTTTMLVEHRPLGNDQAPAIQFSQASTSRVVLTFRASTPCWPAPSSPSGSESQIHAEEESILLFD